MSVPSQNTQRSEELFAEARLHIPGGVDSPVRAFKAVGGTPRFIKRAQGAMLTDADGNTYIDFVGSWGPMILGHAHPDVVAAIAAQAELGTSYGAPTALETELARQIQAAMPSIERVRFVSSGTEATMSALRLARAFTGREKIVKFEGCYHGHNDALLVRAGSGAATFGVPTSPGVNAAVARDTITAPYNDLGAVRGILESEAGAVAAVIIEPIAGNMGLVLPEEGFLEGLARAVREAGALLIFDEVITGFRAGPGGAQGLYGIRPDLTCLGKIIGGGLPVGAFGGRAEIMDRLAPDGPVYQAGTLSGNPLAMAAGIETLRRLEEPGLYEGLGERTAGLAGRIRAEAEKVGVTVFVSQLGSAFCTFFTGGPVRDWSGAGGCDLERFAAFHEAMLKRGIYLPPSQFETCFVSLAHTEEDLDRTVDAFGEAFGSLP